MFDVLKTSNGLITLAFFVAIGASCYYSITLVYLLILAFCGYKCWNFSRQPIIRYKSGISLFPLFGIILFWGTNDGLYMKEMQRSGCHIVSGVVIERYTTKGSKGSTNYHTIVEYEPRSGGLNTRNIGNFYEYNSTTEGQHIIIAEPFCNPGLFSVLEYKPSAGLVERMRHGIYYKGSLSNLETIQDDVKVRESFENYDKTGWFDFFKYSPFITMIILIVLASALTFYSDKLSVFAVFGGVALVVLLSMVTNGGLFTIGFSCLFFCLGLLVRDNFAKNTRVKNEIKRNGGFITMGLCLEVKFGKSVHYEVSFVDAMGNYCQEIINRNYKNAIIIAHSAFNDVDVICIEKNPSETLLKEFKNGKFIGPCSDFDLNNLREDRVTRSKYQSVYTPKEK